MTKTTTTLFPIAILVAAAGCDVSGDGLPDGPVVDVADAIEYRALDSHPGCSTAQMSYAAASIAGFRCAAKEYPFPDGVAEDTALPIVVLIHGNSDTPAGFERFPADGAAMLAERLPAAGFRTYALDLRIDLVDDPQGDNEVENAARNVDHGWTVPIFEHALRSLMDANPGRRFTLIGFSLGVTIIRDGLRRLHLAEDFEPWSRIEDLVYLAGANHGVSSCGLCGANPTMRGQVTCEMGCRDSFSPTAFTRPLNGPDGTYETPCADGDAAFGQAGACGGNVIDYTTIVMRDIDDGTYQDQFVSEESAALLGADNRLIGLDDVDATGYFFDGLFDSHYGAARSQAAIDIVLEKLSK
jgi:pimeloyl-ACP methyl ester carboxylesterase